MKLIKKVTFEFSKRDREMLSEELEDLGFGADNMDGKKQPDEKWPFLGELAELLRTE